MSDGTKLKEQLWKKLSDGPFMMGGLSNTHSHSEPLTSQRDRDQVDTIFFFIGKDNRLAQGGPAMAQFVAKGQDFFACLSGRVLIDNDRAMIDKLWSKPVEAWFPGGKTDPNLALLRFDIRSEEQTSELQSLMRSLSAVLC